MDHADFKVIDPLTSAFQVWWLKICAIAPSLTPCLYDKLISRIYWDPLNKVLLIHQESNLSLLKSVLVNLVNLTQSKSLEKGVSIQGFSRSYWPVVVVIFFLIVNWCWPSPLQVAPFPGYVVLEWIWASQQVAYLHGFFGCEWVSLFKGIEFQAVLSSGFCLESCLDFPSMRDCNLEERDEINYLLP